MFDNEATFVIPIRTKDGLTHTEVRWPSDEEWTQRQKALKIIQKRDRHGGTETSILPSDADLKLYEKIRLNGGPSLTGGEAAKVVGVLQMCQITDCEVEGSTATVYLTIIGFIEVQHKLRLPTADEVIDFRRAAYRSITHQYGREELKFNAEAGAKLWDACSGAATGYKGTVPNMHKDAAVRAVIEVLDQEVIPKSEESPT